MTGQVYLGNLPKAVTDDAVREFLSAAGRLPSPGLRLSRVKEPGSGVWGLGIKGLVSRNQGLGFGVKESSVWGLGIRVWGLGFVVSA